MNLSKYKMAGTCESRNQNVTPEEGEQTGSTVTAKKTKQKEKAAQA